MLMLLLMSMMKIRKISRMVVDDDDNFDANYGNEDDTSDVNEELTGRL